MNIITLTLCPAYDVHCEAPQFEPFCENLARITRVEAGGKGVNISRALTANGIQNRAIVLLGRENGAEFLRGLEGDGLDTQVLEVDGRIRENITLHTPGKPETRLSFHGFSADDGVLTRVRDLLPENMTDTVLTLTGRLPDGVTTEAAVRFLSEMKDRGALVVLDSRSFGREDVLRVRPWLIKPNREEIAMYAHMPVCDCETALQAARRLYESGIENVMISLGGQGAVLCCGEGEFSCPAPEIDAVSTVGAGDSMIAGFLAATDRGERGGSALKCAVAWGSAACLTQGTQPPDPRQIESLLNAR